eukprot:447284_1
MHALLQSARCLRYYTPRPFHQHLFHHNHTSLPSQSPISSTSPSICLSHFWDILFPYHFTNISSLAISPTSLPSTLDPGEQVNQINNVSYAATVLTFQELMREYIQDACPIAECKMPEILYTTTITYHFTNISSIDFTNISSITITVSPIFGISSISSTSLPSISPTSLPSVSPIFQHLWDIFSIHFTNISS